MKSSRRAPNESMIEMKNIPAAIAQPWTCLYVGNGGSDKRCPKSVWCVPLSSLYPSMTASPPATTPREEDVPDRFTLAVPALAIELTFWTISICPQIGQSRPCEIACIFLDDPLTHVYVPERQYSMKNLRFQAPSAEGSHRICFVRLLVRDHVCACLHAIGKTDAISPIRGEDIMQERSPDQHVACQITWLFHLQDPLEMPDTRPCQPFLAPRCLRPPKRGFWLTLSQNGSHDLTRHGTCVLQSPYLCTHRCDNVRFPTLSFTSLFSHAYAQNISLPVFPAQWRSDQAITGYPKPLGYEAYPSCPAGSAGSGG